VAPLCSPHASAQSVVDQSANSIPAADVQAVLKGLASHATNPRAIRVRNLRKAAGTYGYCGEVSVSSPRADFVPFHVGLSAGTVNVFVLPPAQHGDFEEIRARLYVFGCMRR
jgi:hypothetical protein